MREMRICRMNDLAAGRATTVARPYEVAATVGFFDGVHRGHQFLLEGLREMGRKRGWETTVITFERPPRELVDPCFRPLLLSTLDEKLALLDEAGVDNCLLLDFGEVRNLTAREFMLSVVRDGVGAGMLLTGYDNRFGHNRTEGFDDYRRYGHELGIEVVGAEPFRPEGRGISSSAIRRMLLEGDAEGAGMLLGRPYRIGGRVVRGEHVGSGLGFPTANIEPEGDGKLIPKGGVYAVRARVDRGEWMGAMMNIGTRPTFGGESRTIEVNILDFNQDIYGRRLEVDIMRRLRDERPFGSPEALARQLAIDEEEARRALESRRSAYPCGGAGSS